MGIIGSLVIHVGFLFLSSYIYLEKIREEEKFIEVSLISIPKEPSKEMIFIPKKRIRGLITSSLENKKSPFQRQLEKESSPLRWQPKMAITKELPSEDESFPLRWEPKITPSKNGEGLNLDIRDIPSDIHVSHGEGKHNIEGGGKAQEGYVLEITGEAAKRQVFYQEVFKIPEWLEKKGISLNGKFKFWVLPDGSVDRVEIEHSFGYRELDRLAIDAILRWRFSPLKGGGYEELGIAKIKIRLK